MGKTQENKGMASEKRNAKALGARCQPGSGNYIGRKGDFDFSEPESFLGENKATKNASFSLKFSVLAKISREARDLRKEPFLTIDFENVQSHQPTVWVCVPRELFTKFMAASGGSHEVN
jgi:hypothetical protein